MDLARDELRERLDARASYRLRGNQARRREPRIEVLDDRERLPEDSAVVVERRNRRLRIQCAKLRRMMRRAGQAHADRFVRYAFEVQRDANAIRGRAAKERIETHASSARPARAPPRAARACRRRATYPKT